MYMPSPARMLQGLEIWVIEMGTRILEEELVCPFPLWFIFYSVFTIKKNLNWNSASDLLA